MQHYWVVSLQARSLQLYVQNKTYMTNAKKQKGEGATNIPSRDIVILFVGCGTDILCGERVDNMVNKEKFCLQIAKTQGCRFNEIA